MALTKNNISEMNYQVSKMSTPQYQVTLQKHYHKNKKTNLENLKRIINSVKTTCPSLRNVEWRTLKTETKTMNQMLP